MAFVVWVVRLCSNVTTTIVICLSFNTGIGFFGPDQTETGKAVIE